MAAAATPFGLIGAAAAIGQSSLLLPLTRAAAYVANYASPNQFVDASTLVDIWMKKGCSDDALRRALWMNGIDIGTNAAPTNNQIWWSRAIDLARPMPDLDMAYQQWRLGAISDGDWINIRRRHGFGFPTVKDIVTDRVSPYATGDLLALLNRSRISEAVTRRHLAAIGFARANQQDDLLSLRFQLPGPSDLVMFAVKEVWDGNVVAQFGYDEEYDPAGAFARYMTMQGLGDIPPELRMPGSDLDNWGRAYWRAHWQVISPGQAYEMLHRLRPTGGPNGGPRVPGVTPFSLADVNLLLKVADYPRPFRDRLAALSYNVLGRIDVRRLFDTGVIQRPEVIESLQDSGYTVTDATRLADYYRKAKELKRIKTVFGLLKTKTIRAFKAGLITQGQLAVYLWTLLQEDADEVTRFGAQGQQQQETQALADPYVSAEIMGLRLDRTTDLATKQFAAVRSQYLHGFISRIDARQTLSDIGMVAEMIEPTLLSWETERGGVRHLLSTSQILKLFRRGLVRYDHAFRAIQSQGYVDSEITYIMAMTQQDMAQDQLKIERQIATTQRAAQAAIVKQIKANKAALKSLQADLAKQSSPAKMAAWVTKGRMAPQIMYDRLIFLGWTTDNAQRAVDDAVAAAAARAAKESPLGTDALVLAEKLVQQKYKTAAEAVKEAALVEGGKPLPEGGDTEIMVPTATPEELRVLVEAEKARTERAKFEQEESKSGIVPDAGSSGAVP